MTKGKTIALPLAVLAGVSALPAVANAQRGDHVDHDSDHQNHSVMDNPVLAGANLILRVDGMSCPF